MSSAWKMPLKLWSLSILPQAQACSFLAAQVAPCTVGVMFLEAVKGSTRERAVAQKAQDSEMNPRMHFQASLSSHSNRNRKWKTELHQNRVSR